MSTLSVKGVLDECDERLRLKESVPEFLIDPYLLLVAFEVKNLMRSQTVLGLCTL